VERRALIQRAVDDLLVVGCGRLQPLAGGEELADLPEVLQRHRADQRNMVGHLVEPLGETVRVGILVQVSP
jgi:hypothetical protein